jgi:carbonic anhydrase
MSDYPDYSISDGQGAGADPRGRAPTARMAIVTCMDPRLQIRGALGLDTDDSFVLRNAGGRVTDDVLRSLVLCTRMLDVTDIGVIHHTDCRLQEHTDEELRLKTGADFDFLSISDPVSSISEDVGRLGSSGLFAGVRIWGALYVVDDHTINLVAGNAQP